MFVQILIILYHFTILILGLWIFDFSILIIIIMRIIVESWSAWQQAHYHHFQHSFLPATSLLHLLLIIILAIYQYHHPHGYPCHHWLLRLTFLRIFLPEGKMHRSVVGRQPHIQFRWSVKLNQHWTGNQSLRKSFCTNAFSLQFLHHLSFTQGIQLLLRISWTIVETSSEKPGHSVDILMTYPSQGLVRICWPVSDHSVVGGDSIDLHEKAAKDSGKWWFYRKNTELLMIGLGVVLK